MIFDSLFPLSIIYKGFTVTGVFLLTTIVIPACFGVEIGVRRFYIHALMRLFQWGTLRNPSSTAKTKSLRRNKSEEIICKENSINHLGTESLSDLVDESHKNFEVSDVVYLIKSGIEAVIDDEVTKRFTTEELPSWNLLTRTNVQHHFIRFAIVLTLPLSTMCRVLLNNNIMNQFSIFLIVRLSALWFLGLIFRYFVLLPIRLFITVFAMFWLVFSMLPLTIMADSRFKRKFAYYVNLVGFRIICRGFSAVVSYHDRENLPKSGGICVANHTTTLDAAILMQDRPYAVLGQIHGGFLGWIMRMMSRATKHVWFERSEARDRKFVSKRIMEHVSDDNNYPVLLFPEGTCINNTSVMMFKKGSFEIPTTIYPVAIKYNPWFGDAFWNSSKHSMIQYLLVVMTSWAIVADVWYLPPMKRKPGEDAIQFAQNVKSVIARKGGLVDCVWDGQLKRMRVKESYREEKQKVFGEIFTKYEDDCPIPVTKKVRFDISDDGSASDTDAATEHTTDDVSGNTVYQQDDSFVGNHNIDLKSETDVKVSKKLVYNASDNESNQSTTSSTEGTDNQLNLN